MEQMRRDAEQRMHEMNRRAKNARSGNGTIPMPHFVEPTHKKEPDLSPLPESIPASPTVQKQNRGMGLLKMLNFDAIKLDNDILVIALMIMLLGNDDADELLLLALLYIMW
ncbi:MAG: hypothetical protein IJW78_04445 [Clostridia bacterium]|nr:hypothetical protein [Clostridia bacterium]